MAIIGIYPIFRQTHIGYHYWVWVRVWGTFAGFDGLRSPRTASDISKIYNALYKHSGHEPDEWDAGLSCSSSFTSKQRWSVCRIFSVDGTSLLSARSAYVN